MEISDRLARIFAFAMKAMNDPASLGMVLTKFDNAEQWDSEGWRFTKYYWERVSGIADPPPPKFSGWLRPMGTRLNYWASVSTPKNPKAFCEVGATHEDGTRVDFYFAHDGTLLEVKRTLFSMGFLDARAPSSAEPTEEELRFVEERLSNWL